MASISDSSSSHTISVKLTLENYLLWKVQLVPYLRGQRLFKYVDGSCPPPKLLLDKTTTPNLEFEIWLQQDQLVMSALISSLSEPLVAQVVVPPPKQFGTLLSQLLLLFPKLESFKPSCR